MTHKENAMIYAGRKFFLVMRNHDHGLIISLAKSLDDVLNQTAIVIIKTMQRFVEDKKFRIFHEGTSQKNQTLLTA